VVFETFILDEKGFGSVCSGGRYDNLVGLYSKNSVCGIGASFGLDRILSLMESKKLFELKSSNTELLVFNIEAGLASEYLKLAEALRKHDVKTEIFLEEKKVANQFKYAEKKNIPYVLFAGKEEFAKNKFNLKNIKSGIETTSAGIDDIIKIIKEIKK
jgi:histidyl-tRNA synthetase